MKLLILTILLSFILAMIIGKLLIPFLTRLGAGQYIRKEGPSSHYKKAGTPTFGGIIFMLSTTLVMLTLIQKSNTEGWIALSALLLFGIVGFIDDLLKKIHKENEGLKPFPKLLMLFAVSCLYTFYAFNHPSIGPTIYIPFININLNLQGLCSSVTLIILSFLTILSYSMGHLGLSYFRGALVGSLLAFLSFNAYPAKIIMGDTGSLALGGAVATVALLLKSPLIILLIGGVYVIEILSVILQVASY